MSKNIVIILCFLISFAASVALPQEQPQPQTQMKSMQTRSTSIGEGMRLYRQKRYQQAIEEFNRVLQNEPNNAAAHYFSGYAHYVLHHYQEAIASFKKAFEADPSFDPRPYYRR